MISCSKLLKLEIVWYRVNYDMGIFSYTETMLQSSQTGHTNTPYIAGLVLILGTKQYKI